MFNDAQLLSASGAILAAPQNIATLNIQKTDAIAGKQKALDADETNKIFYDNEKSIIKAYHDELVLKNGVQYIEYDDSTLDNAGKLAPGNLHFPAPSWVKMIPKLIDSVQGLPSSSVSSHESDQIIKVNDAIEFLLSGFSDGALNSTLVNAYTGTTLDTDIAFPVGNRIVATDGSNVLYGKVLTSTLFTPPSGGGGGPAPTPYYQHTLEVYVAGNIASAGTVTNYSDGWTDLERKELVPVFDLAFLIASKDSLDSVINIWETMLNDQLLALNSNLAVGAEKTEITNEKNLINNILSEINNWQSLPSTGSTSRFGDAELNDLFALSNARPTQISSRVSQITAGLGNVTQDGEGNYSGSGHYSSLFKWVDLRANLAYGTLRSYYNFDLIITFIDTKINGENAKKSEYEVYLDVKKITLIESDTVTVENVAGLSVTDTVKIIDEAQPSLICTILDIDGLKVKLNNDVSGYSVDQIVRLIKEL